MTETLATGSMEKMAKAHFASEIAWDWSGPQTGSGKPADLVAEFGATWGSMVSAFQASTNGKYVIVDTVAKAIQVSLRRRGRVSATSRPRRGWSAETSRDDAAAATWTFRGGGSRRRRGARR